MSGVECIFFCAKSIIKPVSASWRRPFDRFGLLAATAFPSMKLHIACRTRPLSFPNTFKDDRMIRSTSVNAMHSTCAAFDSSTFMEVNDSIFSVFFSSSSPGIRGVTGGDRGAGGWVAVGNRVVLLEGTRESFPTGFTRRTSFPKDGEPARFACGGGCCDGAADEILLGII